MTNPYVLSIENKLHGYFTRIKELHFSAPNYSLHKIIDDFSEEFLEFDDNLMEDLQSLYGFIEAGSLSPVLPKSLEMEALLCEIRADLADMKDKFQDKLYSGVNNLIDDFWHTVNKTIYLVKIAKK